MGILCRHIAAPTVEHYRLLTRCLRYVRGTLGYGLRYTRSATSAVTVYADADFGNEQNSSKSVSGTMMFIGENLVQWTSRKQNRCANSTCEAEVLSMMEALHDVEYAKGFLTEIGFGDLFEKPVTVWNDNAGAKTTIDRGGQFSSNRHYRIRIAALREAVRMEVIRVAHLPGEEMRADLLTKPLAVDRLVKLLELCNLELALAN